MNSGLWLDSYVSTRENQELLFLPTNSISDSIWYISEDNSGNQRLICDIPNYSNPVWTPNTWQVSKVERVNVKGRTKITLYQHEFNSNSDYVEKDTNGRIVGMWADYYSSNIVPKSEEQPKGALTCILSASTNSLKVGGSYRQITAKITDANNLDVTSTVSKSWKLFIGTTEITNSELVNVKNVDETKIKVKFSNNQSYIGDVITIKCITNDGVVGEIQMDLIST